jgi:molecular chaperone HtpG
MSDDHTKQDPPPPDASSPDAPPPDAAVEAEEFPFQAEVREVLTLVIDSLYANKEVFLRELISNASDALDKGRFLALTQKDARVPEGELAIDIHLDDTARTLTIEDNGIGMTREEIIQNLGTIARSGSMEFLKTHKDAQKDSDSALTLIGQFGVGFYAAFMVGSRIDVTSLSMQPGAEPVLWRSTGSGSFAVMKGERDVPGTKIVVHLKEEHRDYTKAWRVKDVIKKYSDFVSFPIRVNGEVANKSKAVWAMQKSEVTDDQHQEFYRHLTGGGDADSAMVWIHQSVDAPVQYHALLYIPEKAPFDLFQKDRHALRLYAKRVLIMEKCERLTPIYLRFLRGVVDSEDISLNVSREMLQENRTLSTIEQNIVKQVLKELKRISEDDPGTYHRFWNEFGKVLKEGLTVDWKNKDAIANLCRWETMKGDKGELTSLKQYVEDMPEDQREIYFITGVSREAVAQSPHLEAFRKKGYDVLFMIDPIDEWVVQSLTDFEKKKLRSVVHGDVDLGRDESEPTGDVSNAVSAIKSALGDKVKDVRPSRRLTDSAACLVSEEGDPGANFERIMRMIDDRATAQKRILEVNPSHPIVKSLDALAKQDASSERVRTFAELLYDQALLAEGVVEDPAALVKKLQDLLTEVSQRAAGDA